MRKMLGALSNLTFVKHTSSIISHLTTNISIVWWLSTDHSNIIWGEHSNSDTLTCLVVTEVISAAVWISGLASPVPHLSPPPPVEYVVFNIISLVHIITRRVESALPVSVVIITKRRFQKRIFSFRVLTQPIQQPWKWIIFCRVLKFSCVLKFFSHFFFFWSLPWQSWWWSSTCYQH